MRLQEPWDMLHLRRSTLTALLLQALLPVVKALLCMVEDHRNTLRPHRTTRARPLQCQ